ncbi:Permeases of the drug/metabolite transporter (DMT) superfamily [Candidatus Rhodobacter oscarellae]|uniref:Permeases of the drug/metabolite transporter (DMT) superfamily n=1 Tax=Candidatus Rhodobacter oscarellae TaxID=1675527 RepID=A0A0J9GXU3_9RHOB|nr:Permeases of the drug/metabolite transporter (DMT) superfamily [Candidatus Rhodobacter lobularis]
MGTVESRAKLACLGAGAVWGLFWIPLRGLEHAGLHQLWVITLYFAVPSLIVLPIAALRWRHFARGGLDLQITILASGVALVLYSMSIIYTEVVRAILLFYLMPIWGALLGWVVLKEAITPLRFAAMALAFTGMLTIFGLGLRVPLPQNIGDWMGLASGVAWAVVAVRIRANPVHEAVDLTVGFFLWGIVMALGAALLLAPAGVASVGQAGPAMPMLIAFVVVLVIPGTYLSLWGPKHLNPGVVGLLFMTEIVVGAISAAWLSGEPFGLRETLGVLLIAGASLLEPLARLMRRRAPGGRA